MIKNRKGYTLIEVLIVGIIIAILASVAFSNYGVISEKMKAKEAEQTLRSVLAAFISYQVEHKVNPTTLSQLGVTFPPSIYFDPPTVVAQFIPGRVAQIQRQGPTVTITYSDGRVETQHTIPYSMQISFNGTVFCSSATVGFCAKMGY